MPETETVEDQQTDETDGQTEDQTDQTEDQQEDQTVPMERFKEMEAKAKAAEEQANLATQNAQIALANQPKAEQPKQRDIYAEVGLDPNDPEDVPTQAQLKAINEYHLKQMQQGQAQTQFLAAHPDFINLVGTDEQVNTRQYAPPLQAALKANPALYGLIAHSNNPRESAYQIAKAFVEKKAAPSKDEAQAAIDEAAAAAGRVKSAGNAAGGGVLSEEGRIATMSDEDYMALTLKNGADLS